MSNETLQLLQDVKRAALAGDISVLISLSEKISDFELDESASPELIAALQSAAQEASVMMKTAQVAIAETRIKLEAFKNIDQLCAYGPDGQLKVLNLRETIIGRF